MFDKFKLVFSLPTIKASKIKRKSQTTFNRLTDCLPKLFNVQNSLFCTMQNTQARKKENAKKSRILSVHSRRPYFFSSLPDCEIVPAVFSSSSRVPSTLVLEEISVSNVAALLCVVSDSCCDIERIRSVTLSCWDSREDRFGLPEVPVGCRWRNSLSGLMAKSSSFCCFSISSIVDMFALRNA